jgi:hypothetical protein
MKDLFRIVGKMDWNPENRTRKHLSQSGWKKVAMVRTECDIERYYAWFLEKRFNLVLNKTLRGTHMTFINDRMEFEEFEKASEIFHGRELEFFYETEPRTDGKHWWLRAYSPQAEDIREAVGLSRVPFYTFHLTIGHANEKWIYHSEYILRQCQRFEIISNEGRRPFDESRIINPR